jgi:hypothetical protein
VHRWQRDGIEKVRKGRYTGLLVRSPESFDESRVITAEYVDRDPAIPQLGLLGLATTTSRSPRSSGK